MRIFTPESIAKSPQFIDGVENLLTKSGQNSTSSLSLVELRSIELVPNLFSGEDDLLTLDAIFTFTGAAGNKRLRIELQLGVGAPFVIFDATFGVSATSKGKLNLIATIQNGVWKSTTQLLVADDLSGPTASSNRLGSLTATVDPTIRHLISIQALVVVGTDSVVLEVVNGSFR